MYVWVCMCVCMYVCMYVMDGWMGLGCIIDFFLFFFTICFRLTECYGDAVGWWWFLCTRMYMARVREVDGWHQHG